MGIGPLRGEGRRARAWGVALGIGAATLVFAGVATPLAYAMGSATRSSSLQVRAGASTSSKPRGSPPAGGTSAATATATGSGAGAGAGQASHQTSPTTLDATAVAVSAGEGDAGYWEVASDGGIFAAGSAAYDGSMGGHALSAPVVGMAAAPTGKGYWEVASDGGIFSFGTARFYGSMGGHALSAPVVGMAAAPTGGGYWEVASDGGIFSFGTARFAGAAKVTAPARPAQPPARPASSPPTTPPSPVAAPSPATPSANPYVPPSNPPANIAPVPAFTFQAGSSYSSSSSLPCWQLGQGAWAPDPGAAQCVAAEVAATDNARAAEGLPPLRLPSNYSSLTTAEQLFVLTDIERVSRGEQPVAGLSALVSQFAQQGAATGSDPHFPFSAIASSDWWGSNEVSGALSALDANYTWMYQDGYGGDNVDCTSPGASGCWGHRDNELTSNYGGTLVMGAGEAPESTGLETLSELLVVVANPADVPPLYYTWSDAVAAGAGG